MNSGKLALFVNHKVFDDSGAFIGITGVGITFAEVARFIDDIHERYDSHAYFVDEEGTVVLSGKSFTGAPNIKSLAPLAPIADKLLSRRLLRAKRQR